MITEFLRRGINKPGPRDLILDTQVHLVSWLANSYTKYIVHRTGSMFGNICLTIKTVL